MAALHTHSRRRTGLAAVLTLTLSFPLAAPAVAEGASLVFTAAYAENSSPVMSESTLVTFEVSIPFDVVASEVTIFDEDGLSFGVCGASSFYKDRCVLLSNPGPGETKTYAAHLRTEADGGWREVAVESVSVTDPGWTGVVTPMAANMDFLPPGSTAWPAFMTSAPRAMATMRVSVDGKLVSSCDAQGGDLFCKTSFGVGENQVHVVRAEVIPYLVDGSRPVRASSTIVVTSMTPEQLSNELLSGEIRPELETFMTPEVVAGLAALTTAPNTLEACFKLGVGLPENAKYGTTVPDVTLECSALLTGAAVVAAAPPAVGAATLLPTTAAGAVLTYAFTPADVQTVLRVVGEVFGVETSSGGGTNMDPGQAGGGTADNSPEGDTEWYLGSKTAGSVTYAEDAPYGWTQGAMTCRVGVTDPETGEPMTIELDAERLKHIIEDHVQNPPDGEKGRWDFYFREGVSDTELADFLNMTYPVDFQQLIEFICGQVGALTPAGWGDSTEEESDTRVFNYLHTQEASIGNPKSSSLNKDLPYFTVIVALDGRLVSSYPGYTEYY